MNQRSVIALLILYFLFSMTAAAQTGTVAVTPPNPTTETPIVLTIPQDTCPMQTHTVNRIGPVIKIHIEPF
ncbi:MAG: hypothetical protein ACLGH0_04260, partial [Thermoanaerobaculia bacterium]